MTGTSKFRALILMLLLLTDQRLLFLLYKWFKNVCILVNRSMLTFSCNCDPANSISKSSCYDICELTSCEDPMLPHVSTAVILSMTNATQRHRNIETNQVTFNKLCPSLWMQCNNGFNNCDKSGVNHSAHDVLHAYLNVFSNTRGKGNILILEDDVNFEYEGIKLRNHLQKVDDFVSTKLDVGAYTLGSLFKLAVPYKGTRHRRIVGRWACAHAIIWSESLREKFLESVDIKAIPSDMIMHIDNSNFWPADKGSVYTYYKPLATQLFPVTNNQSTWCLNCTDMNDKQRQNEEARWRKTSIDFFKAFKMDKQTYPGWGLAYGVGGFGICGNMILIVAIVIIIVIIVTCFVKLTQIL